MRSMTRFEFGDIVLVPFPFTDQSATKKRPAVVISSQAYNAERPDLVIMAVTQPATIHVYLRRSGGEPVARGGAAQAVGDQTCDHNDRKGAYHPGDGQTIERGSARTAGGDGSNYWVVIAVAPPPFALCELRRVPTGIDGRTYLNSHSA
ncbi:MAG: type II toxin-antitoxin system PemK/MazF family toxin [Pseudomonadota bacterium]